MNITGLELDEINRGDWLTDQPTPGFSQLTIQLQVLPDFPRQIKHWTPVHIYHSTSHSTGKIALLENQRLNPGTTALVDIICDTPMAARFNDQLVLRDFGLDVTLGGGRVVHSATEISYRRRNAQRQVVLQAHTLADDSDALASILTQGPVDVIDFQQSRNLTDNELRALIDHPEIVQIDKLILTTQLWGQYQSSAIKQLEQLKQTNTTAPGLKENEFEEVPKNLLAAVLATLVQQKKIERSGGLYQTPNHQAQLPPQLEKLWRKAEQSLAAAQAPSTGDLAKQWNMPQHIIEAGFKDLVKRNMLIHVAIHRFYLPEQLKQLATLVIEHWLNKRFSVREFRDLTGMGRNVAIEVLEYFDKRGFTRRKENERTVLKDSY